ncbi:MAG: hypothetical protein M3Q48_17720, partial [Actinomycetota bacterium]|nr:hypothetical protein [Actinomycetota bacterium]
TARRAPVVPADGAAIVAALRRAGASPPAGRHVPPMRPVTALELAIFGPDDDLERPTEIMRQPAAVRALVEAACEEGWLLRLAYADGGREAQVTAGVVDVAGGAAVLECAPGWDTRSLPLARVRWARALTEAEEEHVL